MRSTQSLRMHTATAATTSSAAILRESNCAWKIRQNLDRSLRHCPEHCGRAPNESEAPTEEKYALIENPIKASSRGCFRSTTIRTMEVWEIRHEFSCQLFCDRRNLESRKSATNKYRGIRIHVRQSNHLSLRKIIYCTRSREPRPFSQDAECYL